MVGFALLPSCLLPMAENLCLGKAGKEREDMKSPYYSSKVLFALDLQK